MQVPGQCTDLQAFEDPSRVPGRRRPHSSVPPQPPLPLLAPSELGLPKVSIQTTSSTLSPTAESILVFLQHTTRPPSGHSCCFPILSSEALNQMGVSRAAPITTFLG